jgi:hypothetical protein
MPDRLYIHLVINSVCEITGTAKGKSNWLARAKFPGLKRWCTNGFDRRGVFMGPRGIGRGGVENYIKPQKGLTLEVSVEELRRN